MFVSVQHKLKCTHHNSISGTFVIPIGIPPASLILCTAGASDVALTPFLDKQPAA